MMASYQFGNLALANQLGETVVGAPLTDEIPFSAGNTIQATEKGVILYFEELPAKGVPGSAFIPFFALPEQQ